MGKPHREATETEEAREDKKMTSKTTWYLNRKRPTNMRMKTTASIRTLMNNMMHMKGTNNRDERQPAAVFFVKRTPKGFLHLCINATLL